MRSRKRRQGGRRGARCRSDGLEGGRGVSGPLEGGRSGGVGTGVRRGSEHGVPRREALRLESPVGIAAREKMARRGAEGEAHEGGGRWAGRRRGGLMGPARTAELLLVLLAVLALGSSAGTGTTGRGGRDRRRGGRSRGQDRGRSARWRRSWGRVTGRDAEAGRGGSSGGGVPNRGVLKRRPAVASRIGGGSADAVP